jgi:hypothetical protein
MKVLLCMRTKDRKSGLESNGMNQKEEDIMGLFRDTHISKLPIMIMQEVY